MATIRRWTGREARALRQALRMSVRGFAEHLGVSARAVSKWEEFGAATSPRPDTQAILDTALGRAADEAKSRFESILACEEMGLPEGTVDDVRRRTLLGMLGPMAASSLSARLEDLRRGLDDLLKVEPTGPDADDWEHIVHNYTREVGTTPAERLLPDLIADFTEIQARIVDASGLVRTRLIHSTSQLAALTAIACVNAGEGHAAVRWWRTAARAANETSDPMLLALVRGRQAVFSLGNAPAQRVLDLATSAIELGNSRPCVGVISGLAARAQVLAQLGRRNEAEHALHNVLDMYDQLPAVVTGDATNQWNWAAQRLHHVCSYVYTYAGQLSQAASAQDAALAVYPLVNFQGRTQIEFHRAIALVRAGDVDGGMRHLSATLDGIEPWQRRDGIVLRSARTMLAMVSTRQRDLPAVRQARELVDVIGRDW